MLGKLQIQFSFHPKHVCIGYGVDFLTFLLTFALMASTFLEAYVKMFFCVLCTPVP